MFVVATTNYSNCVFKAVGGDANLLLMARPRDNLAASDNSYLLPSRLMPKALLITELRSISLNSSVKVDALWRSSQKQTDPD